MQIYLIRHGKTKGNLEGRYVGRTDEDLLPESEEELSAGSMPVRKMDVVYCSRLRRCLQTAQILFPERPCVVWDGLEEMDFGSYEYKNYAELKEEPAYQAWIESDGAAPFPEGEGEEHFRARCRRAFLACMEDAQKKGYENIAFVVHGGTIMAVMEAFAEKKRGYYGWQVKNGCGFRAVWENSPCEEPFLGNVEELPEGGSRTGIRNG